MRKRRTIGHEVSFTGAGLHSGINSSVTLKPSEQMGISFVHSGIRYPVSSALAKGGGRGTILCFEDGMTFQTVEHLLAALSGYEIDDVDIHVEGGMEIPAMDGCSLELTGFLKGAGYREKESYPDLICPEVPFGLDSETGDKAIWVFPAERTSYTFVIRFDNYQVGTQSFTFVPGEMDFERELAPARTFCFEDEIEDLRARGLARGGSLDNAVVVGSNSVKAKGGLRFKDEFARHKLLDLMGDLVLAGSFLRANVVAWRSGHELNTEFALRLRRKFTRYGG